CYGPVHDHNLDTKALPCLVVKLTFPLKKAFFKDLNRKLQENEQIEKNIGLHGLVEKFGGISNFFEYIVNDDLAYRPSISKSKC
ncbi:10830_t:CDS:2, partial [Funneliformis caledonium]